MLRENSPHLFSLCSSSLHSPTGSCYYYFLVWVFTLFLYYIFLHLDFFLHLIYFGYQYIYRVLSTVFFFNGYYYYSFFCVCDGTRVGIRALCLQSSCSTA
jgi:hypothetical protein